MVRALLLLRHRNAAILTVEWFYPVGISVDLSYPNRVR